MLRENHNNKNQCVSTTQQPSTFTVPTAEYAILGKKDMFCVTSSMVCEVMCWLND